MASFDYYKILDVSKDASTEQIKLAFRNLAFQYHPDRSDETGHADKMKQINEAYAVLSDPKKRREYDALYARVGSQAYDQFRGNYSEQDLFRGTDIQQIFEEMARSFGLRGFDEIFKDFYGDNVKTFHYRNGGLFAGGFLFSGGLRKPSAAERTTLPWGARRLLGYLFNKAAQLSSPQKGADFHDTIQLAPEAAKKGGPYAYYHRQLEKKLVVQLPKNNLHGQKISLLKIGSAGKDGGTRGDLYLTVHIIMSPLKRIQKWIAGRLGR